MGRELARQNGACWRCAKRVVDGCKKSGPLRASKKCVFLKKGAIWKEKKYWKVLNNGKLKPRLNFTTWRRNLWQRQAATKAGWLNILVSQRGYVSQLLNGDYDHRMSKFFELALAFGMVRKEKRIVPIVSIVVKKKQEGEKQPSCSAFYFLIPAFSI